MNSTRRSHRNLERSIDFLALASIFFYTISLLPSNIFDSGPATGGDMGSHFWPLKVLLEYGLTTGNLRIWNPGNLGGEPYFLQYFPLPYFVMALLSTILSTSSAYNLGTLIPILALPICVYASLRLLRLPFPSPICGAAFSGVFLFNESYSMWGGNAMSVLSGQFAHSYALALFMLSAGIFFREFQRQRFPWQGVIASVGVGLSHAYVFLGVPFLLLSTSSCPEQKRLLNFRNAFIAGLLILGLLCWFILPMIENGPWTTDFSYRWGSDRIVQEAIGRYIPAFLSAGAISLAVLSFFWSGSTRRYARRVCWVFFPPALGFLLLYFVFPILKLIDVRALPQVSFFSLVISGACVGLLIRRCFHRASALLTVLIVGLSLLATDFSVVNFQSWAAWNYSGWGSKPLSAPLQDLSTYLRGSFSDPRIAYEHSPGNQAAGSERVFEMLPYFSNRATMESVYHYATLLSPAAFHLQAELSKTPSCPFPQYECPKPNLSRALVHARLLGVGGLILIGEEMKAQARNTPGLTPPQSFPPWDFVQLDPQPNLVEVPKVPLLPVQDPFWDGKFSIRERSVAHNYATKGLPVPATDWKERFYQWFVSYDPSVPYAYYDPAHQLTQALENLPGECHPSVRVNFSKLVLHTDCPKRPHVLRFAYHTAWTATNGDALFVVSPGFIGLLPSESEVTLEFSGTRLWNISWLISGISLLILVLLALKK
ncbi:MAG: hypothetical protein J0M12_03615 [Deltaproteobacteria bacterium]|nr:hypothetical protein [Deltaproteobacteria bacterium]